MILHRDKSRATLPAPCRLPRHVSAEGTRGLNLEQPQRCTVVHSIISPRPQNHLLFSPCDLLALGTRKMGALRLTSLCRDSLDHRGWGDAAQVSHQSLREKPLSDEICWGGVRTCLPHSGGGPSGELQAPLRSEPRREAPGLHNELMERLPQLSRDWARGRRELSWHCACSQQELEGLSQQKESSGEQHHPCQDTGKNLNIPYPTCQTAPSPEQDKDPGLPPYRDNSWLGICCPLLSWDKEGAEDSIALGFSELSDFQFPRDRDKVLSLLRVISLWL